MDRLSWSIGQSQSLPPRPFPKQAYDTDANRLCPRRCCTTACTSWSRFACWVDAQAQRCQMADAAVRCDTQLLHNQIRLGSITTLLYTWDAQFEQALLAVPQLQTHRKHRMPLESELQIVSQTMVQSARAIHDWSDSSQLCSNR